MGYSRVTPELLKPDFKLNQTGTVGLSCDNSKRKLYRCWTPSLEGVWLPQVHTPCAHNLVRGLLLRTMGPTPPPTTDGEIKLERAFSRLKIVMSSRVGSLEQWAFERVVASYGEKRLRVRYEQAALSLAADGLCTPKDARVKAFVKGELLARYKVHKPRVIMGRSPRYNLELASYLKPIEHALYPALRGWGRCFTRTRLIGKGLNPKQRAELLRQKFESRPDLCCFEIDGVSFESHFSRRVLQLEHSVYTRFLSDPRLAKLLSWQLKFEGRGEGVEYYVEGVRASGDFNTGLGNTLVMCCLVLAVAEELNLGFDFLADGDNAVVFVRQPEYVRWKDGIQRVFLQCGFEVAAEKPVTSFEQIVFGQSKPCFAAGCWTMVRDPYKVLSHAACGFKHFADMRGGLRVLKAIGYCEAVLSKGVPVLQTYAHAILKATRGATFSRAALDNFEYARVLARGIRWEEAVEETITPAARESFEKAWGVSVQTQLAMEARLKVGFECPRDWSDVQLECEVPDIRDHWSLVSHRHSQF